MRRLVISCLVGIAILAACGDSADTTTTTTALPTVPPTPTTVPATTTTVFGFPITLTAANGDVTIEAPPQRIVSLSATHTEMLYAIGADARVAGTDLTSNYPPAAEATPKVDAFNFDVEEVANLDPDLVVLAFNFAGEVDALDAIGVPALLLPPPATLGGALDQLRVLGLATGRTDQAGQLIGAMEAEIGEVLEVARGGEGMTFFHEVDNTLYSPNSSTFIGDIYARFGLTNIADEVPDEFASGYVQLSQEYVLEANPDFIFLGDAAFGETAETVAQRPGWGELSAVQNDRVVELDSDVSGRWGPRTVDLVRQIGEALGTG